jgi:hypothetical protein
MKPFEFKQADTPWPAGTQLLHVYVTVDPDRDAQLIRLVDGGHTAVAGFPITAIAHRWLHLTIDQVSDRAAIEITQRQREDLVDELRARMARIAPFTVQVGSMLSYHSGVIADVSPDDELAALHHTVHDGIRAVRGEQAARYPYQPAHLSIAHAHAETDSDLVQQRLRRVRPSTPAHRPDPPGRGERYDRRDPGDHLGASREHLARYRRRAADQQPAGPSPRPGLPGRCSAPRRGSRTGRR